MATGGVACEINGSGRQHSLHWWTQERKLVAGPDCTAKIARDIGSGWC